MKRFPKKTPAGKNAANQAQILFDNKIGTAKSQYDAFNKAFSKDAESINSAKSIYTRFKLAVGLHKTNQLPLQDVFDLYDETQEKLNKEATKLDGKLQKLLDKEESGTALTAKEARRKKGYNTNLKAFGTFAGGKKTKMISVGFVKPQDVLQVRIVQILIYSRN